MPTIKSRTFYLEMRRPPAYILEPIKDGIVLRAVNIPVSFYRFLFRAVGERWLWVLRAIMSDEELKTVIHDPFVEIYVLYVDGSPAGFAELDRRTPGEIELVYFGLLPEYFSKGLGKYFLRWVIYKAWEYLPERLWLHTCEFDHPAALPNYLKAGFVQSGEEILEHPVELLVKWRRALIK